MNSRANWIRSIPIALLATVVLASGCSKEGKVADHLSNADRYFEARELEKAKIEYVNVLRIQSTNAHALSRLGKIFYAQDQFRQAFPLLERARTAYPEDLELREALVTIFAAARTNLWRAEAEAIWQRDPANETAILAALRMCTTPAELNETAGFLESLHRRAGDRAIFELASAEVARRLGRTQEIEPHLRRAIAIEPSSVAAHLSLGSYLFASGKAEEAGDAFRKAAELSPPHGRARLRLSQYYLQTGKVDEAERTLDELIAKAPEVIPAFVGRAEIALGKNQAAEALRMVDRALVQSPSDVEALRVRGKALLSLRRTTEALKDLERAVQLRPESPDIHYQLGVAHLVNQDLDRAHASLRESLRLDTNSVAAVLLVAELDIARGAPGQAIPPLVELAGRRPDLPSAPLLLARAYRATGRLDDALTALDSMRRRFPSNAAPVLQIGLLQRDRNRIPEAREAFESCLRLEPGNLAAVEQLTALDVEAKNFDAAESRIGQQLRQNPKSAVLHYLDGMIHAARNQVPEAETAFRRAIAEDPESQPPLMALARLYVASGRRNEALAELERAVARDPANLSAVTLLGILHVETGNLAAGRSAYERAIKVRPDSLLVLNNLAYLLAERMNLTDEAYPHALRARELGPQNPVIADTLGWLEYRRGNFTDALRLVGEASEKLGHLPEVQYHLGMIYYALGNEQAALLPLRRALASSNDFPGRKLAEEHLSILESPVSGSAESVRRLEALRAARPRDVVVLDRLAAAYVEIGAYEKARDAAKAIVDADPRSTSGLVRLASLYAERFGDARQALQLARQARDVAPTDPVLAQRLGKLAYLAGDHEWAYSLLQEGARQLTNSAVARFELAKAAFALGRSTEAVDAMNAAGRLSEDPALTARSRQFVELVEVSRNPDRPGAADLVNRSLRDDPADPTAAFASGRLAENESRLADARRIYEALLEKYPAMLPAARQLTLIAARQPGDDKAAFERGMKAREGLGRDPELSAALGKIAWRLKDPKYAVQLLQEARPRLGQDAELHFVLGLAQAELGQVADARSALEKAIALGPRASFAPEARKRLDELRSK